MHQLATNRRKKCREQKLIWNIISKAIFWNLFSKQFKQILDSTASFKNTSSKNRRDRKLQCNIREKKFSRRVAETDQP